MKKNIIYTLGFVSFLILIFPAFVLNASASDLTDSMVSGTIKAQGLRKSDNILVYLTKTPDQVVKPEREYVLDQNNLTFLPHVLVIPMGASVQFPNNDKVDHNVFSLSRTRAFNFGSYKPGESQTVVFEKPGIVELRCDLHSEMISYILVLKNSYFALTDKQGNFTLDVSGLEPGKYFLKTWHEKLKNNRVAIQLPQTDSDKLTIQLKRGAPGVLFK